MKRVSFAGFNTFEFTAGDTVRLHVPATLTLSGLPWLDGSILYIQTSKNEWDGVLYRYIVEFDETLLVTPSAGLDAEDVNGLTYNSQTYPRCRNDAVTVLEEFVLSPSEMFYSGIDTSVLDSPRLVACRT